MLRDKLETLFNIRPGEGTPTIWLLIHSFFIGFTLLFTETASYALFLTEFDAKTLPWVYIFSAPVIMTAGFVYSKAEEKLSFQNLLIATLGILAVSIVLLYISYAHFNSRWITMAALIWHNVLFVLTGVEFWGLAGRIFDVQQGKRLFGLIGAGEVAAGIVGGFSVPMLMKFIGTSQLLLLASVGMAVCLLMVNKITQRFSAQLSDTIKDKEKKEISSSFMEILVSFFKERYLILLFAFSALTVFGYNMLDYIFYDQVESQLADEKKIASFLGIFFAVLSVVNFISNTFVPGRILPRYGLSMGLLAVPVTLTLGVTLGLGMTGNIIVFFWVIAITKLFDEVARISVEKPSVQILYQPIPEDQRLKVQTLVETLFEPTGSALAGILIWFLTSAYALKSSHFIYVILLTLMIWFYVAVLLRREYTSVLKVRITKRKIDVTDISSRDPATIAFLEEGLKKPEAGEVIYCLNVLEEIEHEDLEIFMTSLLDHEAETVRKHVLERIGELHMNTALEAVKKRLEIEISPEVVGAALQTLCAIAEAEAFEQVFTYVQHDSLEIRKGALVALLRNSGIDGVLAAGANFNSLLDSDDPQERKLAAHVLGEVGIAGFYRPLVKLLEDNDLGVRAAAIVASGKLKNPNLLPLLIKNLSVPDVRKEAVSAMVAFGEVILPELEIAFDEETQPREVRSRLIRILGRIGGDRAVAILNKKVDYAEEDIRNRILDALVLCKYRATGKELNDVIRRIRKEVEDAVWTLGAIIDIGEHEYALELISALNSEIERNIKRVFFLLAMIHSSDTILSAQKNLASTSQKIRANAIDALTNIVSRDIWAWIEPLVEDNRTHAQRYARLVEHFSQEHTEFHERIGFHERLKEILGRSQQLTASWTKACALFTIGKIATMEFYDVIISSLSDPDSAVRETAIWALGCLNPNDLPERLQHLTRDKSKRVADYARFTINSVGFASIPMSKGYLTRSGKYTVDLFRNILMDDGERRTRRCRAANILSRFRGPTARAALIEGLSIPDKTIRTAALDALIKGKYKIEGKAQDNLLILLEKETIDGQRIIRSIAVLLAEERSDRLIHALNQEIKYNRKRMLSILVLLSGEYRSLNTIFYWYIYQEDREVPENVMKVLRILLSQIEDKEIRKMTFVLFHQYRGSDSLKKLKQLNEQYSSEKIEENLKEIAFDTTAFALSWSRICALELIVMLNFSECVPHIIEKLNDSDDIVRATAAWALYKMDLNAYNQNVRRLKSDPSPLVSRTAKQLETETSKLLAVGT